MSYQLVGKSSAQHVIGVILPTYGEADNISSLIEDIEQLNVDASILVIDDSSPDGTAAVVLGMQKKYPNDILLYSRPKKSGLGTAITDGFKFFLSAENPPSYILTMDADYSHNPQEIPQLLSAMKESECGIVIGSRYVEGGKILGWPFFRKIISKTANSVAKVTLRLKLKDCTSGFRVYSTAFIRQAAGNLHSHTFEIQIETVRQAALRLFYVKESPIVFVNRKRGKSKLTWTEVQSYLSYILKAAFKS
jgi:dolichol-phosphate mannosyltransferase